MSPRPLILLVEDNPDDEALTLRAFKRNDLQCDVAVARDGAEAVDFLFCKGVHATRDPRAAPALILLDLNLPKLDGIEVLRAIRADPRTKLLPVVVLTSSLHDVDRVASYGLGANSYVRKPVDFQQFVTAVAQLGVYWLVLNQPPPRT